mmetsp:Transcript_1745/g.4920  ORF Transcript_1745/g.4920 Transcript_1745/m.4920 type:complete len:250 (+) Transcript_1745:329-1078(+)
MAVLGPHRHVALDEQQLDLPALDDGAQLVHHILGAALAVDQQGVHLLAEGRLHLVEVVARYHHAALLQRPVGVAALHVQLGSHVQVHRAHRAAEQVGVALVGLQVRLEDVPHVQVGLHDHHVAAVVELAGDLAAGGAEARTELHDHGIRGDPVAHEGVLGELGLAVQPLPLPAVAALGDSLSLAGEPVRGAEELVCEKLLDLGLAVANMVLVFVAVDVGNDFPVALAAVTMGLDLAVAVAVSVAGAVAA